MAQGRTPIEQVWTTKGNLPNNAIVATADGKYPALDGSLITGLAGGGDMTAAVYDPTTIQADAFARVNHTGTQTAATISDFDTEVSNNTTVAASLQPAAINTTVQGYSSNLANWSGVDVAILNDVVFTNTAAEPTGSDQVVNIVSLTQAEYDAGTPVATTFYIITA